MRHGARCRLYLGEFLVILNVERINFVHFPYTLIISPPLNTFINNRLSLYIIFSCDSQHERNQGDIVYHIDVGNFVFHIFCIYKVSHRRIGIQRAQSHALC